MARTASVISATGAITIVGIIVTTAIGEKTRVEANLASMRGSRKIGRRLREWRARHFLAGSISAPGA
jgi:hypothetical protein